MSWRQAARVVVSGSFRRDTENLQKTYDELRALGCQILSPYSLDFTSFEDDFAKTKHERDQSVREIEEHHLHAIRQADFVWLHAPEGYIGLSGALEIGYAVASGVSVFSASAPVEPLLRQFVTVVPRPFDALYLRR